MWPAETSYSSTQFWQYLPGNSIRSHGFRAQSHKTVLTSDVSLKSRLLSVLLTGWLQLRRLRRRRACLQRGRLRFYPWVPLEQEMATHSSILAWRIPQTEEPSGLWSMESQRVGHNWVTWILEWIPMPFSRGSSRPRDRIHICGCKILYCWVTREASIYLRYQC